MLPSPPQPTLQKYWELPEFQLTDAAGGATITLESLRARGKPVLLVFIGIGCMPSSELLPDLARWQRALADRLTVAVVSRGGPQQHDFEVRALGMSDVGLQSEAQFPLRLHQASFNVRDRRVRQQCLGGSAVAALASQSRPHFHGATSPAFADAPRAEHALLLRRV